MERIVTGYSPGAIGRIAEMHGTYYHRHWKFGLFFEAKVATELAEFLSRFDTERDGFWTILHEGQVEGAIAVDGIRAKEQEGAHLRWFIVNQQSQSRGWGKRLLGKAVSFCDRKNYRRIYLWTFEGLDTARNLYEAFGFRIVFQRKGEQWGARVNEQLFERTNPPT
jgi:GNAT superfamily N-acetyltransferase